MTKIPRVMVGWCVLVVDDEQDSLDIARMMLEFAGAKVLTATDGQEALAMIERTRPHFILSDLSMPEMDGWQLIRELNLEPRTREIPVIALTAHAMSGDRERALQAGFVNYITKPLDTDKFITQLLSMVIDTPQLRAVVPMNGES
jgi:two-component system, cell cycle response regulator DivK